ncbi:MAG: hypothetical protein FWG93_05380 [Oscillospiraceae bacterium]|nr:hypothetical protein [Oscillospiraceae bacterium]
MDGAVLGVSALALALAEGRTQDEVILLGAMFTQLGDTLATIAALRDRNSPPPDGGTG